MKSMWVLLFSILILSSCRRQLLISPDKLKADTTVLQTSYIDYIISQGDQFCDKNFPVPVDYSVQKFSVLFDSSAIYTLANKSNQSDINKLYGFSDNNTEHHVNSARIGWRWSDNALRLFAYVYNNEQRSSLEIATVSINKEIICSIEVRIDEYHFSVNGIGKMMPRASTTATAKGYKLYPYFGGDEKAPHKISIRIKEY